MPPVSSLSLNMYITAANIADSSCGCKASSPNLGYVDPRSDEFDYVAAAWDAAAQCASSLYDTYIAAYCETRTGFDSWVDFLDPTNLFANPIKCPPDHYVSYPDFRKAFNCYQNLAIKGTLPEPSKKYPVDANWLNQVIPVLAACAGVNETGIAAIFLTFNKRVNEIKDGPKFLWPKTYGSLDIYRQEAENSGSISNWINKNFIKPVTDTANETLTALKWIAIGVAGLAAVYAIAVVMDKAPSPKAVKEKFQ